MKLFPTSEARIKNKETKAYKKREDARKLRRFEAYKYLSFAFAVTGGLAVIFLLTAMDFSDGFKLGGVGLVMLLCYGTAAAIMYLQRLIIRRQILNNGSISLAMQRSGILTMAFVLCGNVFAFYAGCMMLKKRDNVEYKLAVSACMLNIIIMEVSALNLFKGYVVDTFLMGMVILATTALFYGIVAVLSDRLIIGNRQPKWLIYLSLPMAASILTGNVFALIWAGVVFYKATRTNKEASVKAVDVLRRFFRNYTALTGLFIVVFLIALSICSNFTFDYDTAVDNNYAMLFAKPTLAYPFGCDDFGRCVFTRIVSGAKITLLMGLASTAYPLVFGIILGAFAGYYGGRFDNVVMRCMDILYSIPGMLLTIVMIAAFGSSIPTMVIALGFPVIASYARTIRAQVLNNASSEYVEAAVAYGASDWNIVVKHIVPNSLTPIIINATSSLGTIMLSTSGLSFLGIGLPVHLPEWGNILRVGSQNLEYAPYLAISTGLCIVVTILAFNFFGDGLRDALDPKYK